MKKFTLLLLTVVLFFNSQAQVVSDTVSMGAGYTNDVYYSLEDGYVSEVAGSEWTVAFYNSAMSASIKINEGHGVKLWLASENISDFGTIDTTGNIGSWEELHDSELIWSRESAFEDEDLGTQSNYGWGEYNFTTHVIQGSRVFVIKTVENNYYKVIVESKITGEFSYRYASLDNVLDTTITVNTTTLLGKNYAYLNMDNQTVLDRDPIKTEWDLLFTKYWDLYASGFGPPAYDIVTGVLINDNVGIVEVRDVASADAVYSSQTVDTIKNVIGWDFKYLDASFMWALEDSLSYFIQSNDGDIFHLYFTRFDGTSTGIIGFNTEKIFTNPTSIQETETLSIHTLYPNPTNGSAQLIFSSEKNTPISVSIYNLLGKLIHQADINANSGLNTYPINLNEAENGVYLIQLNEGNKISTQKIILNK